MQLANVFTLATEASDPDDPPPYDGRYVRLGEAIGGSKVGGTIYELAPGQSICPYHYEYGNEEWLLVVAGRPTLRTPEGERELEPGDAVCFPEGPEGAHAVRNDGEETLRVLMLSTKQRPDISVYPDSDKIGVWPGNADDTKLFVRGDAVPYFRGEVEGR